MEGLVKIYSNAYVEWLEKRLIANQPSQAVEERALPTIDEIQERANNAVENLEDRVYFIEGAEWMRGIKGTTDNPREFIKSQQAGVLLNDYTLKDMEWFMVRYAKHIAEGVARDAFTAGFTLHQSRVDEWIKERLK